MRNSYSQEIPLTFLIVMAIFVINYALLYYIAPYYRVDDTLTRELESFKYYGEMYDIRWDFYGLTFWF